MGQAILYCCQCQKQLRSHDFEKSAAFRLENRACCRSCVPQILPTLSAEAQKALRTQVAPPPESDSTASENPAPGPASAPTSSTARMGLPRLKAANDSNASLPVIGGLCAAGAVLLLAAIFLGAGHGSFRKNPAADGPGTAPEPEPYRTPAPEPPRPPRAEVSPTREPPPAASSVPGSLVNARTYAISNPGDLAGQIRLYERALEDLKGTSTFEPVRRELEALRKKADDQIRSELASLDTQIRERITREEFGRALDVLDRSRNRYSHADWARAIEALDQSVRQKALALFVPIRERAVEAKRKGALEQVRSAQEQIARWGIGEYGQELSKAISEATPPLSPESSTFLQCWEGAAARAQARDFSGASDEIKRASSSLRDAELRKEAADDLEIFQHAGALLKEALQLLPKWQQGQRVSLDAENSSSAPETLEGSVARIDPYRVELQRGDAGPAVVVPFGEIRATTLVRLLAGSGRPLSPAERRGLAAACLLQGGLDSARSVLEAGAGSVPEKYWARARSIVEAASRGSPTLSPREAQARSLYASAEAACDDPESAADGAQIHATLLKDYSDTGIVSRNRAFITLRSQGAKEYLFLPSDFSVQGDFDFVKNPKTDSCLTAASDLDPSRLGSRHVEIRFSVLPATEYRLWVYVGACCLETFAFSYQATELTAAASKDSKEPASIEPGSSVFMPVKLPAMTLKKTHAAHTGPKGPSRWEWIQIPLPKFASPGKKQVRWFSNQKGFSIAYAFVSAQRASPPGESEIKAGEKLRIDTPGARPLIRPVSRSPGRSTIADFETDPVGWRFTAGQEYPGAKGGLVLDASQAHSGQRSYRLDGDFSGGGRYVGLWCDLSSCKDRNFKELRLWVKTSTVKQVGIRITDSTGQCHQKSGFPLASTADWQELILKIPELLSNDHWAGANDGKWHGPAAGFGIHLSGDWFLGAGSKSGSLWIDDVEGVLDNNPPSSGPIRDPSYEAQAGGDGAALLPPWSSEGPAIAGCDSQHGLGGGKCAYIYDGTASGTRTDIVQVIRVTPNTTYTLSCAVETDEVFPAQGSMGVRTTSGVVLSQKPFGVTPHYMPLEVTFKSGSHTTLVIFAGLVCPAGTPGKKDAWIHVDDWSLSPAGRK